MTTVLKSNNHTLGATMTFDELFDKYFRKMVLFGKKFLDDEMAATDIATDAFVKLYETRNSHLLIERQCRGFVYVAVSNACVNHIQRKKNCNRILSAYFRQQAAWDSPPDILLIRKEVVRIVMETLETLPRQCRKIMKLKYIEGLLNREIADHCSLSINTVRNQVARGISLIKDRLIDELK